MKLTSPRIRRGILFVDPILLDIPDIFETRRLMIRGTQPGDGAIIHAGIVESLAELAPWMPWATPLQTLRETEIVVRRMMARRILRKEFMLPVFLRDGETFVGCCGLHHIDWKVPKLEIGYWQRTSLTGNGYMTEAVIGLAGYCKTWFQARRLEIRCSAGNTRSAAVAERAGFTLEARLRGDRREAGQELTDTLIYAQVDEQTT